jgi:hypothetical protein
MDTETLKNTGKNQFIVFFIPYLLINALFAFKYGSRQNYIDAYLLTFIYVALLAGIPVLFIKVTFSEIIYKNTFYVVSLLFFLFTIWINYKVDGYQLNTDRWSAMEAGIKALLNNKYPYSALDHLNGRTSNLPTLILIGIPFHLIGNVGYFQSFSFLLFIFLLIKTIKTNKARLFALLLLISSASYGWEIYSKSDLISNIIIVAVFVVIIQMREDTGKKTDPVLLGILSAALALTRLVVIIPLALLLVKIFFKYSSKDRIRYVISASLSIAILLFIVFRDYGTFENFKIYNPFILQNRQFPFVIGIILIMMPVIYSYRIKGTIHLIKMSIIFLLMSIMLAFILKLSSYGIYDIIYKSAFDISYFNIVLPFLIIYIALSIGQPDVIRYNAKR